MGLALLIVGVFLIFCTKRLCTCIRRSRVPKGYVEGFGVFIYGPLVVVLSVIEFILGMIYLISKV